MRATRRLSQAISEGDGISVLVPVSDADGARAAERDGAEGIVLYERVDVRDASALPILWAAQNPDAARDAGADACVIGIEHAPEARLLEQHAEAEGLGLESVVNVRDEDELELVLERLDPEILLLSSRGTGDDDDPLEHVLDLLPDIPAGKLAIADVAVSTRDDVVALERAGIDAVIVAPGNVAELVGGPPPEV